MILLNGKQLDNSSINQNNMSIQTSSIVSGTSVTNKEYLLQQINEKAGGIHQSRLESNMQANNATVGQKACDTSVIEFPVSNILVSINGTQVNVGSGLDCYFSGDGGVTPRPGGNGEKGDYLYWNKSEYDLETTDEIDFNYLVSYDYFTLSGGTTATLNPVYNNLVVKYTGGDGTTMTVIIDGVSIIVGNVLDQFVWDIGGVDEHTFTTPNESIIVTINGNNYTIWWDGFGSLIFSVKKGGEIPVPPTISGFSLEIQTTSSNQFITLPHLTSYVHNYTVDYGDSTGLKTVTTYDDINCTHEYITPGTYTITISGTCETFYVNNNGTLKPTIKKVLSWGNVGLKVFNFYGSTNLTSVVTDTYSGLSKITTFLNAFISTSLSSIPSGLFDHATGVTTFQNTFRSCPITSVPTDLFRYNTQVAVLGFMGTFFQTNITTVPTDLFRYNTLVSNNGFRGTFYNCYNLTSIPTDLFRYNTLVSFDGFYLTFINCTSLTSVPDYLFRYNTANGAGSTYGQFRETFRGCTKLQVNPWTFYADGEQSTRFSGITTGFMWCFQRDSFNGTQGTAPDLWNCTFGSTNSTTAFYGTGNDATSISNYSSIPAGWK